MDTNVITNSELTNFDQWQLEKYGNIIPSIEETPDSELFESGIEELNRLADWTEAQAENRLVENQPY